jgi:cytochrome c oxidase subunit 3/cytochrome o ubiquinol oxidase subunit 3
MSTYPLTQTAEPDAWELPARGPVAMLSLIVAESAIFTIFVVAYLFYLGKSLSGPTPSQVLQIPWVNSICLLSSSATIWRSEQAIKAGLIKRFSTWWMATVVLGAIFLVGTAQEWRKLIETDGLTIHTNLFGTTFYSLVGLHAFHVVAGLVMLGLVLAMALAGRIKAIHAERIKVLAIYWHFVDAVWVVVFTVVYLLGR